MFGLTFTVNNLVAVGAGVVAIVSLFVSIAAYRQRARYHPQAKLVVEWGKGIEPLSGLFFRDCIVYNHGDAPARDFDAEVSTGEGLDGFPWMHKDVLEPGQNTRFRVPVVGSVVKEMRAGVVHYSHPGQAHYKFETPVLKLKWRQPPFDRRPRRMRVKGPHTPNLLSGETS